ncbi:MAG: hypothetical protein L3K09_07825, partial [Thermoplasmata archaeon]|nr:hypothetical protein [Thermoplasmata archaeon]
VVGVLANPATAGPIPTIKFSPPFHSALPIAHDWRNHTSGSGSIHLYKFPASSVRSGRVAINASVAQVGRGHRTGDADMGFALTFKVPTTRTHHVTVNWTVDWNASANGTVATNGCRGFGCLQGVGSAHLYLYSYLLDGSNNTTLASTWITLLTLIGFRTAASTGNLTQSLALSVPLVAGHAYILRTYLRLDLYGYVLGTVKSATASATFNLAAPNGATLNWASVS